MTCDFVSCYAGYADVLEAPRILHELVGIQIVATLLNRNGVSFQNGAVRYSLDLWMALLSGSGAGRSTTVGLAAPVLEKANMEELEHSERWGSAAAFYQHCADHPCGLIVRGEMSELMKQLNEPKFATCKEWLTDRFDSFKIPPPHTYRRTQKKNDTPTIKFTTTPRINMLATSASEWFFRNLAEEDSAGGYLARWTIVKADDNGRDIAIPRSPDASLVEPLAQRLSQIGELKGEADISTIEPMYVKWYSDTKRRFEAQPNRALAMAYFNRHRGLVLKLAVVFEASRNAQLKVSPLSWVKANQFAQKVETSLFKMLPTGMSAAGYNLQKIEDRIRQAGSEGLSQNELTRAFQSMNPWDREQQISTLKDASRVFEKDLKTGGRTKKVYVHEDYFRQEES
jgi:hypothetical protein